MTDAGIKATPAEAASAAITRNLTGKFPNPSKSFTLPYGGFPRDES